jgi:hypothetical protein
MKKKNWTTDEKRQGLRIYQLTKTKKQLKERNKSFSCQGSQLNIVLASWMAFDSIIYGIIMKRDFHINSCWSFSFDLQKIKHNRKK